MLGIEGLYTAIGAIIHQLEDNGCLAIDAKDIVSALKGEVDIYSVPRERFVNFALEAASRCGLYQNGYRSVVRGEGLFVNLNACNKKEYLARLFNNAKLSESAKTQAVNLIMKQIKTQIPGQLTFDFDTGDCIEEVSEEELIAMLKADAHSIAETVNVEMAEEAVRRTAPQKKADTV